jgi:multidrug efflux pump
LGASSTSRIPLGIVIVGGIMFSLVLTLFVIPAMYSFLSSKKKKSEIDRYIHEKKEQAEEPNVEQAKI